MADGSRLMAIVPLALGLSHDARYLLPTFPEIRNPVREIMAALYFVEHPGRLQLANDFFQRNPPLRI
jgi:hypothetical protein